MENKRDTGMLREMLQKGKKIVRFAVFCAFAVLLCAVFAVIGMIYSLADFAVRKLGKGGYV